MLITKNKFIAKTKVTSTLHKNNTYMIYIHIVIDYICNCIPKLFKDEQMLQRTVTCYQILLHTFQK